MAKLYVPALYPHQETVRCHPSPRKLWRAGRRAAKTTGAFHMTVLGHGAPEAELQPHKGLVHGLDVLWVTKDYPLAAILWQTEIAPRFRGLEGVRINESEHTVTLPNGARLWLRSAEAIQGVRGIGKNLGGCVCSEAAHWDLEVALQDVIIPALLDNQGWLLCESTTYAGSYFNQVAQEIRAGAREDWAEFYHTALDNPRISEAAFHEMVAEYPQESDQCRQEVYAELIEGGAGLAFPMWSPLIHTCKEFDTPKHWRWVAGMDWGITAPSIVLLAAIDTERRCLIAREWKWQDKDAYEAGYDLATAWLHQDIPGWPEQVWCDSAMAAKTGIGGTTVLEEFQAGFGDAVKGTNAPGTLILAAPKGPGSIIAGYNAVRKMLDWGPLLKRSDGTEWLPPSRYPRMRIVKERCPYLCKTLPVLRLDEKKQDQVESGGENHGMAALRYLLAGVWPEVEPPRRVIPQDVHPGYLPNGQRRSRVRDAATERAEKLVVAEWQAQQTGRGIGGRYGRSARRV